MSALHGVTELVVFYPFTLKNVPCHAILTSQNTPDGIRSSANYTVKRFDSTLTDEVCNRFMSDTDAQLTR